ncbi:MAG: DUF1043 family protein [Trueperaceae bacterium]
MLPWWLLIVAFVTGALAGTAGAIAVRRRSDPERRLQRMRRVLDRFQGEVAQHFEESGTLITRLRADVEQLYGHLERGAAELTTEDATQARLRALERDTSVE